jgi:hypothetical protein
VSIHPSGRLALTVGADKALRLWDLTKGRPAFTAHLPAEPLGVKWSDDGALFAVLHEGGVSVHDGATGAQVRTLSPPAGTRLLDMTLFTAPGSGKGAAPVNVIAVGCEGGDVRLWEAGGAWCRVLPTGHARRVRCVAYTDAVKPVPAAAPAASSSAAAAATAAAPPNVDLHPLSKMNAAAAARVTLSQPGPFLVTVDSEATVKMWHVPGLLAAAAAPAPGGKAASAPGDIVLSGIEPAATLKTGSPARATALATTRLRTRAQSEMKGHVGATAGAAGTTSSSSAAAAGGKPAKQPAQPSQQQSQPKPQQQGGGKKEKQHQSAAGQKRPRAPEDGAAAAAAPPPSKGKQQGGGSAPAAPPAAAPAPFAFGFKINAKQRPVPAPEPASEGGAAAAAGAAAPPAASGEQPPVASSSKKSKHQPQQGSDGAGGGRKGDAKGKGVRFAL